MKDIHPFQNEPPRLDWRALGQFKLSIEPDADSVINAWLKETLAPLNLPKDFLGKVLKSARELVTRVVETATITEPGHLHFSVFASTDHISHGQAWGFFRIEKLEDATEVDGIPNHTIEFYLYPEG